MERHTSLCHNGKRGNDEVSDDKSVEKKTKIDAMVIKTSRSESRDFDKQVARYVLATNSPFHDIENKQFKILCQKLHPGYKPPSEREVSGHLLDEIYNEQVEVCRNDLEGL